MNQRQRVLLALQLGPATSTELVDDVGFPLKHCSAILGALWRAGRVIRGPAVHRAAAGERRGPSAYLYSLPAPGLRDASARHPDRHRWPSRRPLVSRSQACCRCGLLRRRDRRGFALYGHGDRWILARPGCRAGYLLSVLV